MNRDLLFDWIFFSIRHCEYLREGIVDEALLLCEHLLLLGDLLLEVVDRYLLLRVFLPHLVVGVDHVDLLFFEYVDHILGLVNEEL